MTYHKNSTSFLDLPREIRAMVYDNTIEDVNFSNALESGTAYTPMTFPLLYVHDIITQDLQHYLYRRHAIVVPIQKPRIYATGRWKLPARIANCSRLMKQRSEALIIEMYVTDEPDDEDAELEECGQPEEDTDNDWEDDEEWDAKLAERLVNHILALKPELPAVERIKLVFWFGEDGEVEGANWRPDLEKLMSSWPELALDIQFNFFDYDDPDAGIAGLNFIQRWDEDMKEIKGVELVVRNFEWEDDVEGNYQGRIINVEGWPTTMVPLSMGEDEDEALDGGPCEGKPMFINLGS